MVYIIDTGERILPEKETRFMFSRHISAYEFTKNYVKGRYVLDAGCGEGYGSFYLSRFAKEVMGTDYDEEIIKYANNKYKSKNLEFKTMDITKLEFEPNVFDVVCAFQVIEHIKEYQKFLYEIYKVLKEGGYFICSTPNKEEISSGSSISLSKYHYKEFTFEEFYKLLSAKFKNVKVFFLDVDIKLRFFRRLKKLGIFRFIPKKYNPVTRFYNSITPKNFIISERKTRLPLDFIGVCQK